MKIEVNEEVITILKKYRKTPNSYADMYNDAIINMDEIIKDERATRMNGYGYDDYAGRGYNCRL